MSTFTIPIYIVPTRGEQKNTTMSGAFVYSTDFYSAVSYGHRSVFVIDERRPRGNRHCLLSNISFTQEEAELVLAMRSMYYDY